MEKQRRRSDLPTLIVFGAAPLMAVSQRVTAAIVVGAVAVIVFSVCSFFSSALSRILSDNTALFCSITISAALCGSAQMLLRAYLPSISRELGVYLLLLSVNFALISQIFVRGRRRALLSLFDGATLGMYIFAFLVSIAVLRESIGAGSIAGARIPYIEKFSISALTGSAGGYLMLGFGAAIINKIFKRSGENG